MQATKYIDHAAYQRKVKRLSEAELLYIIKDAGEAYKAYPTGPNAGYYADEVNYAATELNNRRAAVRYK